MLDIKIPFQICSNASEGFLCVYRYTVVELRTGHGYKQINMVFTVYVREVSICLEGS